MAAQAKKCLADRFLPFAGYEHSMFCALLLVAAHAHQTPSGPDILKRAQAAYDAVKTLTEDVTGHSGQFTGTAHIQFKRPGLLRVTGNSMFGSPYQLLCDGKSTEVFNSGTWSTVQSPELGIATITGVSANAGTAVPAALFHTSWGSLAVPGQAGRASRDTIGGRSTYRVDFTQPFKHKLWFDTKTYFLVKSEMSVMGQTITVDFGKPIVNKPIPSSAFKK